MREYRLGDTIDDYCIKCKRITNHNIVSLTSEQPAKMRCCSCYNDHDYRREIAPPTKKELQKAALLEGLLGKDGADDDSGDDEELPELDGDIELPEEAEVAKQDAEPAPKRGPKSK